MAVRSREDAIAELRDVVTRRAAAQDEADALYVRQVELYVECHERVDPPVLMKDIALIINEAAPGFPGGTLVAVSAAIKKLRDKQAR